MKNKTLVIGASSNPKRYSYLAINKLIENNYKVIALGIKPGFIGDILIHTSKSNYDNIHTVTLYINPNVQKEYYDYILSLNPKRIIFNPGTENNELATIANKNGIITENACTLVLLSLGKYGISNIEAV